MYLIISWFFDHLCFARFTFSGSITIPVEIVAITIVAPVMVHVPMTQIFAMVDVYQMTTGKNTFTLNNLYNSSPIERKVLTFKT